MKESTFIKSLIFGAIFDAVIWCLYIYVSNLYLLYMLAGVLGAYVGVFAIAYVFVKIMMWIANLIKKSGFLESATFRETKLLFDKSARVAYRVYIVSLIIFLGIPACLALFGVGWYLISGISAVTIIIILLLLILLKLK